MLQKIIVKLYDVDGCLYHAFRTDNALTDKSPTGWLLETNANFLAQEIKYLNDEVYDKVIIAYGTNRQDYDTDELNARGNPRRRSHTCAPALPILQSYFSHYVNSDVVLEPFLMADLYHDAIGGTSYFAMLKQIYANQSPAQHNTWVFDDNKLTLIYTYAHRTACLHAGKNASIVIDFFDDKDDILAYLKEFFERAPDLLPRNVTLRLNKYMGKDVGIYPTLQGTGPIDFNYQWSVRFLAIRGLIVEVLDTTFMLQHIGYRTDNKMEILREFHQNKRYFVQGYAQLNFQRMFKDKDLEEFRSMRKNTISKLARDPIFQQATYTTAQKLLAQKLIPPAFVIAKVAREEHSTIELAEMGSANITTPLLGDRRDISVDDFTIAIVTHNKIIAELNKYIAGRGSVDLKDIHLNWISRHFRNTDLTREKLTLAHDLREKMAITTNYSELLTQLEAYQIRHEKLERRYQKTYGCFTKSGLAGNLNNIGLILLAATAKPMDRISRRRQ